MKSTIAASLLLAFSALFLAGCYEVPVTGRRAMNLVDDKEVTKMSIGMFDDMKRRYRVSRNKDHIDQLQRVGDRLSKVVFWDMPDADWEFIVFDVPQINAFAMAGGAMLSAAAMPVEVGRSRIQTTCGGEPTSWAP